MNPFTYTCKNCKGHNISSRATVYWNHVKRVWEADLDSILDEDELICNDCVEGDGVDHTASDNPVDRRTELRLVVVVEKGTVHEVFADAVPGISPLVWVLDKDCDSADQETALQIYDDIKEKGGVELDLT
jgi:hypothetical protein